LWSIATWDLKNEAQKRRKKKGKKEQEIMERWEKVEEEEEEKEKGKGIGRKRGRRLSQVTGHFFFTSSVKKFSLRRP